MLVRKKTRRIIITFNKNGCPEGLKVDDREIRDWNDAGLHLVICSERSILECDTGSAEPERRPEYYPEGRKIVRKVEIELDEKECLATVTIDGCKVYDRSDPAYFGRNTTLRVESRNWGFEQKVQLTHDFV